MNDAILREISDFCRRTGLAESTFGRRAVNDGKLASRLRNGGRITTDTLARIRAFMSDNSDITGPSPALADGGPFQAPSAPVAVASRPASGAQDPQRNFRFFDNRQK